MEIRERALLRRSSTSWAAVIAVVAALGTSAPAPAAPLHSPVRGVAAKTCSAGYTRGRINGKLKCLHVGEFCTHSADRQYRHDGFRCIRYYRNVHRYRLTYA